MAVFLIGIIIIAIFDFPLQSIFQPSQEKIVQYVVKHSDDMFLKDIMKKKLIGRPSNIRNQNRDPFLNSNINNDVYIGSGKNEFRFSSSLEFIIGVGCVQNVEVFKGTSKIDSFKVESINKDSFTERKFFDDSGESYVSFKTIIQPNFYHNPSSGFQQDCAFAINEYSVKASSESFDFNISIPSKNIVEGQDIESKITIINNMNQKYLTDIELLLEVDTIFGTLDKTIVENDVILNPGRNELTIDLSSETSTEKITITPKLILKQTGSRLRNLNYGDSGINWASLNDKGSCSSADPCFIYESSAKKAIESEDWIPIGTIIGDKQIISISPKPLYLEKEGESCPNNYVLNEDSSYCIRDDIRDLTCNIIGCPTIDGVNYECTSAGICAETVFLSLGCKYDEDSFNELSDSEKSQVNFNEICPSGTTCDLDSGLCVKSEIFSEVIQCDSVSDCSTPCEGKIPSCDNNKCVYSGECSSVSYGCNELGCSEGYECNEDKNVCEKETIINIMNYIFYIAISILVIFFIGIIYLVIRRRK